MGRIPTCSICIETLDDFSDVGCCPCGHTFHHRCIKEWERKSVSPSCPTCMEPLDKESPGRRLKQLYFSFDGDSLGLGVENLVKRMDLNYGLEAQVRERGAEIECLKKQLTKMEAAMKEEKDLAKKILEDKDFTKKMMAESKDMAKRLWKNEEASRIKLEEAMKSEKEKLDTTQERLQSVRDENSVLKAQVVELQELNEELRSQIASASEATNASLSTRHLIIKSNGHYVDQQEIKLNLTVYGMEFVSVHDKHADVIMKDPDAAQAVVERFNGPMRHEKNASLQISYATLDEEERLRRRCVVATNIHFRAELAYVDEDFHIFGEAKNVCYLFDPLGKFSGAAIVECHSPSAAMEFGQRMNESKERLHRNFFHGWHLRVEPYDNGLQILGALRDGEW